MRNARIYLPPPPPLVKKVAVLSFEFEIDPAFHRLLVPELVVSLIAPVASPWRSLGRNSSNRSLTAEDTKCLGSILFIYSQWRAMWGLVNVGRTGKLRGGP